MLQMNFFTKIQQDLNESKITAGVMVLMIPVAFGTYLFHEFGHWTLGWLTGNEMVMSLNNATPKNGNFIKETDALWSAIGGPLFTIIEAFIFLIITWFIKSIYAYSVTFFAGFSRFFSILLGGFNLQDEAGIARMLDINKFLIAAIVLTILALILWKCTRILKLNLKAFGYFVVLGVIAICIVIGVDKLFF